MTLTIAPAVEAAQSLVAQINAGTAYALAFTAVYREELIDPLEQITALRVDVCPEEAETLNETLDNFEWTSHQIRVWIRSKCAIADQATIDALKLTCAQIIDQVRNFFDATHRVRVWEWNLDGVQQPDKRTLQQHGLFVASVLLRVEVAA